MSAESHFQMTKVIRLCSSWPFYIKKEISFVTFSKLPHFCLFTELEAGWGDLWKSRCPSPLLLPSHCWPKGCPDLQGRTLPPWAACCSSQSASQEKYVLVLRWKLTSSSLCSLPLVLSLGISDKSLAPASLLPHFRWWYMMVRTSLSFLLAKHSLLPHALLIREVFLSPSPFVASSWTVTLGTVMPRAGHCSCVSKGKDHLCHPAGAVPSAWSVAHCWLLFRAPGPSLQRGFSSWMAPGCIRVWDCSSTAHFSSLQSSLGVAAGPTGVSASPSFVSPAALLRACSARHH